MILYNYRYRGPYEYDKFVNNILQFSNEVKRLETKLLNSDYGQLKITLTNLDQLIGIGKPSAEAKSMTGEDCLLQQQLLLLEQIGGS